jgi:hypothetical protein
VFGAQPGRWKVIAMYDRNLDNIWNAEIRFDAVHFRG